MAGKKNSRKGSKRKTISLHEIYEERRAYPRIAVNALAEIILENGESLNVILYDLSPDGVQLRCNKSTAFKIHPSGKFIVKSNAPVIDLKFSLNVGGLDRDIKVQSGLTYFTIISEKEVVFGANFLKFSKFCERHVETYIMEALSPVEEKVLDILDQSRTADYISKHIREPNINLDDTLNLLVRKKNIISYGKDEERKFIKVESALGEIFERIKDIEAEIVKLKEGM